MSTTHPKNQKSAAELLQATANLSTFELDKFVDQAIILRAKRHAQNISGDETELLLKINQGFSPLQQQRFEELAKKLEAQIMSFAEREEFIKLTNLIEKQDAKRIELLGKLAEIRKQTLDEVMKDLGIGQL
jgi:hypothetical protein